MTGDKTAAHDGRANSAERRSVATHSPLEGGAAKASEVLELLLSAGQQGIVEHDLETGVSTYNKRWFMLLGFQAEHCPPESPTLWQELSHPDDLPDVLEEWQAHIQDAWPFQKVWRMRHREGGYRWVECHSALQLNAEGQARRALSVFADVTERVEEANRHIALLEAIPDTILRVDSQGMVLDLRCQEGSELLFAHSQLPQPLTDVAQSELAELLIQNAQEALRSRTVARCNYSTARDGNARHFEFRCSPSGTEEVVFLARDVTETKMMESQLLQAQKLESIGQLAAGIAHEINTPLQFIGDNVHFAGKGISSVLTLLNQYSERLNELVDPEEAQSLRKQARKMKLSFLLSNLPTALSSSAEGVGRVAEIVAAMKEFSHPGSKTPTPADINRALRSTTKVSTNEWKHVADLELDLDESIPQVSCVLGEVNQCFLNIIVNASHALKDKYGDEKRGVIQISTKRRDSGVEIRIQDNGPGIPESTRQRIFDPFFTTKEVGKGTGQGLAIARSTIVDKHHGELVCESTVGEGTTFVIYLPYEQPGAEATEDDEAAA